MKDADFPVKQGVVSLNKVLSILRKGYGFYRILEDDAALFLSLLKRQIFEIFPDFLIRDALVWFTVFAADMQSNDTPCIDIQYW